MLAKPDQEILAHWGILPGKVYIESTYLLNQVVPRRGWHLRYYVYPKDQHFPLREGFFIKAVKPTFLESWQNWLTPEPPLSARDQACIKLICQHAPIDPFTLCLITDLMVCYQGGLDTISTEDLRQLLAKSPFDLPKAKLHQLWQYACVNPLVNPKQRATCLRQIFSQDEHQINPALATSASSSSRRATAAKTLQAAPSTGLRRRLRTVGLPRGVASLPTCADTKKGQ